MDSNDCVCGDPTTADLDAVKPFRSDSYSTSFSLCSVVVLLSTDRCADYNGR